MDEDPRSGVEDRLEMIEGQLGAIRIQLEKVWERLDRIPLPEKNCPETLRELCLWIHDWIDHHTAWAMEVHNTLWPGGDPGDPPPPDKPPFGGE